MLKGVLGRMLDEVKAELEGLQGKLSEVDGSKTVDPDDPSQIATRQRHEQWALRVRELQVRKGHLRIETLTTAGLKEAQIRAAEMEERVKALEALLALPPAPSLQEALALGAMSKALSIREAFDEHGSQPDMPDSVDAQVETDARDLADLVLELLRPVVGQKA